MPYCDKKKIIFMHIPKTGGTTIKKIFKIPKLHNSNPAVTPSPQHLTCELLRKKIGDKKYNQYYKFAFVRNPWARMVSDYFWRQQLPKKRQVYDFSEFIENAKQIVLEKRYYENEFGDHFIPQTEYTIDVDDVFLFENFQESVEKISDKLGMKIKQVSKKKKRFYDGYQEYYNEKTRTIIEQIYHEEIEKFEYKFLPKGI